MATADVGSPVRVRKKRSFDAAFKLKVIANYTWYVHFHMCKQIVSASNNAHACMKLIIPALFQDLKLIVAAGTTRGNTVFASREGLCYLILP